MTGAGGVGVAARRMKLLRQLRRISYQKLADMAGASKQHMFTLETVPGAIDNASYALLCNIAGALGVSITRLMSEDASL